MPEHRHLRSAALALAAILTAASCTDAPPSVPGTLAVRDSAGIRIIDHSGSPWVGQLLTVTPVSSYGWEDGDYPFQRVLFGALQPDGGSVVADMGSQEVLAIPREGGSHTVVAGAGEGPKELSRVMSVRLVGQDTFWVEDDGNGKLMLFSGGELARTVNTGVVPGLAFRLMVQGLDGAGRFLMTTSSYGTDFDVPWLPGQLVVFDPESERVDTVGSYDMAKRQPQEDINPFSPFGWPTAAGGHFVYARNDLPRLTWVSADGNTEQIVRWPLRSAFPTEGMWSDFIDLLRQDLYRSNPGMPEDRMRAFLDQQTKRFRLSTDEALPLFGFIQGMADGSVWVSEYTPGPAPRPKRYAVFTAGGEQMGVVEFPQPTWLLDARDGRVLGVAANDMDVVAVVTYELAASER